MSDCLEASHRTPVKTLFTVDTNTYFKSQLALAYQLSAVGGVNATFVFTRPYPSRDEHLSTLASLGIQYVLLDTCGRMGTQGNAPATLYRGLKRLFPPMAYLWQTVALRRRWRKYLLHTRPLAIVLPAQNRFDQLLLAAEAKAVGVTTIVCPLWMSGPHEQVEAIRGSRKQSLDRPVNLLIAKLFPRWVGGRPDSGDRYLALPWGEVVSRELLGLHGEDPWVLHSGASDRICVESPKMQELGQQAGLDVDRMAVTGSVFHDIMFDFRPRNVNPRRVASSERPLEICTALPQDMFESRRNFCRDFDDYPSLVDGWLRVLSDLPDARVMVSLHPTATVDAQWAANFPRLVWTLAPIELLLPNCDLFVAAISATIQWARACGVPVINYDVYGYDYPDYLGDASVEQCTTLADYRALLAAAIRTAQPGAASDSTHLMWGTLDGGAATRILAILRDPRA